MSELTPYKAVVIDILFRTRARDKREALAKIREQIKGAKEIGIYMNPEWVKLKDIKKG